MVIYVIKYRQWFFINHHVFSRQRFSKNRCLFSLKMSSFLYLVKHIDKLEHKSCTKQKAKAKLVCFGCVFSFCKWRLIMKLIIPAIPRPERRSSVPNAPAVTPSRRAAAKTSQVKTIQQWIFWSEPTLAGIWCFCADF